MPWNQDSLHSEMEFLVLHFLLYILLLFPLYQCLCRLQQVENFSDVPRRQKKSFEEFTKMTIIVHQAWNVQNEISKTISMNSHG